MIDEVQLKKENNTFDPNTLNELVPVKFRLDIDKFEELSEDELLEEFGTLINQIREKL